jgi:hypothetical protein
MRTGDTVFHKPTGETWLVAYVEDDGRYLAACGWPFALVPVDQCELRARASDKERHSLLLELAGMSGDDMRKSYALRTLGVTALQAPRPDPEAK